MVLLDEATASLDVENETKVQGALSRLLAGKTVLVIAHRMRTVAGADRIVVLDNGRVAEQGTPRRADGPRRTLPPHGGAPEPERPVAAEPSVIPDKDNADSRGPLTGAPGCRHIVPFFVQAV